MAKRFFKSKWVRFIFIFGLVGSIILIFLNYSQIETYQIKFRNDERQRELKNISEGLKKYILVKNTCPTTSTPIPQTYLAELIIDSNNDPKGGVSIASLENIDDYFNKEEKDPSGNPYFAGIYNNLIYLYTNDYELSSTSKKIYFQTVEASLCNQVLQ